MTAKIMIVEDNEMNRDMLCRRLERRGYETCFAADGLQAIEQAKALLPDLILLDLSLPEVDGWEVARRLKAESCTARIPIIAVTALAMVGDRERCLEAGASDYLTKPLHLGELATKISHWLAQR